MLHLGQVWNLLNKGISLSVERVMELWVGKVGLNKLAFTLAYILQMIPKSRINAFVSRMLFR
jgi:hypothetical protein